MTGSQEISVTSPTEARNNTGSNSVSVVICAHTMMRVDLLCAAIESVESQTVQIVEIVVVCDHNPELKGLIESKYPALLVIENTGKKGLSGARNTGIKCSSGDIVAFIDDDAVAKSDWLEHLLGTYSDPLVIGAGGLIEPVWPEGRPVWFPKEFDWVIGCSYTGLPNSTATVRNLIGCNMSVRRDVLEAVGGFRETLGRDGNNASGCEETELYIQAQEHFPEGIIRYEPAAMVLHNIEPLRTHLPYFKKRCLAEGKSKAEMVRTVGAGQGLSSERDYTFKVLPKGVFRGLFDALRGDLTGLQRSAAIVFGFTHVAGAFAKAKTKQKLGKNVLAAPFKPILTVDVELQEGVPDLPSCDPSSGQPYGGAHCLVRSAGRPVDLVQIPLAEKEDASAALETIFDQLPATSTNENEHIKYSGSQVTVVIATRDRAKSLARCLDSLLSQSYPMMDIVVVDNAPSSPETEKMIAEEYQDGGRIRYVREDRPGLARAHNTGLLYSTGDIIAFTDDDVVVDHQWVEAIAGNFGQSERIGCVTGLILPAELATRAQLWTEAHGGFGKGFERLVFDLDENRTQSSLFPYTAGAFGSGANMAFSREAIVRVGGFDNALGAGTPARGGDDLASFVSVINAGFQLVYEPRAIVRHYHRRAESGIEGQAYGYGVGLGAYITKQVVDRPALLFQFATLLPTAMVHLFSDSSQKIQRLPDDYPRRLVWKERFGILMGVPGYLRSRYLLRGASQKHKLPSNLVQNSHS
jgi:GT2 family glycosyltransferase